MLNSSLCQLETKVPVDSSLYALYVETDWGRKVVLAAAVNRISKSERRIIPRFTVEQKILRFRAENTDVPSTTFSY